MGSFNNDYIIYIREQDGSRTMFSAGELRDRLYHCIGDPAIADDITLAVEYSLLNRRDHNHDLVFDRGETDAAVVRLLEETGYPEAAVEYRSGSYFEDESINSVKGELLELFKDHLGCSENHLEPVCDEVLSAACRLGINEASPHLYLELGRYFSKHRVKAMLPELPELPEFGPQEVLKLPGKLGKQSLEMWQSGVIDIECVTAIFPCVKFHVRMEKFSAYFDVSSPVTELLVYPAAAEVSNALEDCRRQLQSGTGAVESQLPCTLVIHELRRFVRDAFECADDASVDFLSGEMGEIFALSLESNIFKLDFD